MELGPFKFCPTGVPGAGQWPNFQIWARWVTWVGGLELENYILLPYIYIPV